MPCCGAPFASTKLARCRGMLLGAWIVKTGEMWIVFWWWWRWWWRRRRWWWWWLWWLWFSFFPAVFDWNNIQIHKYTHILRISIFMYVCIYIYIFWNVLAQYRWCVLFFYRQRFSKDLYQEQWNVLKKETVEGSRLCSPASLLHR